MRLTWPPAGSEQRRTSAVVVRLTEDAVDDLASLNRHNPPAVRWCLKKMLLLEHSPMAGEPLLGDLVGFRKLMVGDRHRWIVWWIAADHEGGVLIDVAGVWAAGARADSEVYAELRQRVAKLGDDPRTRAFAHVVEILGKAGQGLQPRPEPFAEPVPDCLASALTGKGIPVAEVAQMAPEEAFARWNALARLTRPRPSGWRLCPRDSGDGPRMPCARQGVGTAGPGGCVPKGHGVPSP